MAKKDGLLIIEQILMALLKMLTSMHSLAVRCELTMPFWRTNYKAKDKAKLVSFFYIDNLLANL